MVLPASRHVRESSVSSKKEGKYVIRMPYDRYLDDSDLSEEIKREIAIMQFVDKKLNFKWSATRSVRAITLDSPIQLSGAYGVRLWYRSEIASMQSSAHLL
jgi:hypothetical protein